MVSAVSLAADLGLPQEMDRASDPFFGRVGQLMAANQVEQALKFELLIPVRSEGGPTACMSFNYHRDHFGKTWTLVQEDGETAHSGCVAFGIDRLAVALFANHGTDTGDWPESVRALLRLN
jgi:seryl-tRNA synthetase